MTEHQRERLVAIVREQPALGFVVVHAVTFLFCSLAFDALLALGVEGVSGVDRYLLSIALAFVQWLRLRNWARRVHRGAQAPPAV